MNHDEPTLHVLPRWDDLAVCIVRGGRIDELLRFPVEPATMTDRGWHIPSLAHPRAVSLDPPAVAFTAPMPGGGRTQLVRLDIKIASSRVIQESILDLPDDLEPQCLRSHRGRLFAGGASKGAHSPLAYLDWNIDPPLWQAIEFPFFEMGRRSGIAALLVDNNRLIGMDNTHYPKLLRCEISGSPVMQNFIKLDSHSIDDQVKQIALGETWIVVLSSIAGNHPYWQLLVLGRGSLAPRIRERATPRSCGQDSEVLRWMHALHPKTFREWHDIAFCGDKLILAAGEDGFGVFDLDFSRATYGQNCQPGGIDYCSLPKRGEALAVEAIDAERVIVTYRIEERLESLVICV